MKRMSMVLLLIVGLVDMRSVLPKPVEGIREKPDEGRKAEDIRKEQERKGREERRIFVQEQLKAKELHVKSGKQKLTETELKELTEIEFKLLRSRLINKEIKPEEAVQRYKELLAGAVKGIYDASTLLRSISATDGLLTLVLVDKGDKTLRATADYLFDDRLWENLPDQDKFEFAEKIAQASGAYPLNKDQRKIYKDVFTKWVDKLMHDTKPLVGSDAEKRLRKIMANLELEDVRLALVQNNLKTAKDKYSQIVLAYDAKTALEFFTPTGGFLHQILADQELSKTLLSKSFLEDLSLEDGLAFSEKIAEGRNQDQYTSLSKEQKRNYDLFFIKWMNSFEDDALSNDQVDLVNKILSQLPRGEVLKEGRHEYDREKEELYKKWFEVSKLGYAQQKFAEGYAEALISGGSGKAIADAIVNTKIADVVEVSMLTRLFHIFSIAIYRYMEGYKPSELAMINDALVELGKRNDYVMSSYEIGEIKKAVNRALTSTKDPKTKEALQKILKTLG